MVGRREMALTVILGARSPFGDRHEAVRTLQALILSVRDGLLHRQMSFGPAATRPLD